MQTEPLSSKTSATNDESAPQLAGSDLELRPSDFNLPPTLEASLNTQKLVAPERSEGGNHQLSTINHQLTATVIDTKPLPAAVQPHKARRTGRVAGLPKIQRDMVNRMLSNGVPYKNIVAALDEGGFARD